MSGLPVSHVGEKVSGGVIATGSPTVHVGASGVGIADRVSACVPNVGQPVNPMLGCKLLPEEVDFALAAPDTFTFGRGYLSSNPRISRLGQGWWLPGESMHLELSPTACVLIDAQGRRISFPALAPGAVFYSGTERLWLRRGGAPQEGPAVQPWKGRWAAVPEALAADEGAVLLLVDTSYLHFQRQADGVWRLHATFGRSGYRTEFGWSQNGLLTSIRDSAGRSYALVYQGCCEPLPGDDGVRLQGVILANVDGPVPADLDLQSRRLDWLVRYQFNDSGDLVAVRNRLGEVVRVFAWHNHILVAHGEPGGLEVRYTWDLHQPHGRVLKQSETDGLTREFRYQREATEVVDSLGRIERYEFSGSGGEQRWTALVRADGSRTEFEYDMFGRLVLIRDPLGREFRRRLDGQGRVLEEQTPGKTRFRKSIDDETGLLKELIDSMGRQWLLKHDASARLLSVQGPAGITRYAYDDPALPDRPTQVVDARGGIKRLTWNRLGLLASVTDCSGQTRTCEYDGEGQLLAETDALGQVTRRGYDHLGQVTGLSMADGTQLKYRYDAQGRQTHMADGDGHFTQFFWDRAERLTCVTDAAGHEQHYRYDEAGRLVMLTNENGAQAHFAYDLLDRLVQETGFDGRCQRYRYNAADELVARVDADERETTYAYNLDGRLLSCHLPATASAPASSQHYRWLADGRLAGVKGADCELRFAYDEAGNLCLENQIHADGWVYSVAHRHDELGARQSSRFGDAPEVNWLTYGPGHVHGVLVAQAELAFERDALHRETRRDGRLKGQPEALFNLERRYDRLGRLTHSQLTLAAGDDWRRSYQYDALGQLTGIDENLRPNRRYDYDRSGRLVASQRSDGTPQRYAFDPAGNRFDSEAPTPAAQHSSTSLHNELYRSGYVHTDSASQAGPQSAVGSLGNRVEAFGGSRYRYDGAGNLLERIDADGNRLQLAYDGAHRLVHLVRWRADGVRVEARYRYDGLSRRIAKTVREGEQEYTVRFGWDGDRQCAEAFGQRLRTTVYEPGTSVPWLRLEQDCEPDSPELLQVRQAMATEDQPLPAQCFPALGAPRIGFFHTDHIGTPLRLSDEQGRTLWQAEADDWRAITGQSGSTDQPLRFQGQYHDLESDLYYNRYRYYLPELGRYATQDPIGLRGGPNLYVYALNVPSVAYDPTGLFVPLLVIGAFALRGVIGAGIELGVQAGKQVLGQVKDNWDNDRELTDIKWKCIDINWKHVAVSGAVSTVAPGMLTTGKNVLTSAKALKTLNGQAANTANRAAKLAARKAAHSSKIKSAVGTQIAWQGAKQVVKCPLKDEEEECQEQ